MSEAEINRAVAERVMGWKAPTGYRNIRADAFQPITNPADAMAVLKRCLEKGGIIEISKTPGLDEFYVCEFATDPEMPQSTLELAICQFALKLFP